MDFIKYKNGNYTVLLDLKDGTKIRYNVLDTLIPNRPESIDVKITNKCNHNCGFCHENSNPQGQEATLKDIIDFAETIPPYTEIALGGGNLMEDINHTEMALHIFKRAKAIVSITIRQDDFMNNIALLKYWQSYNLIYGIGISLTDIKDSNFWRAYEQFPTAIIHVIVGVFKPSDVGRLVRHKAKVLFLGYKMIRKGKKYFEDNAEKVIENIQLLKKYIGLYHEDFNICSFDNLALQQLDIDKVVDEIDWKKYYMGEDGTTTFFVDLVKMEYASSSTSLTRYPIKHNSVLEMFNNIRKEKNE